MPLKKTSVSWRVRMRSGFRGFSSIIHVAGQTAQYSSAEIEEYRDLVSSFPSGISLAFAYGSGAFHQKSHVRKEENMLDLIFAVNDSFVWHEQNMQINPTHYSALQHLGPGLVTRVQQDCGARVYYNSLVKHRGRLMKYGIISVDDLIDDLNHWRTLYISGRLHKPVRMITMSNDWRLTSALDRNLRHATRTALLCLPESFSEVDFYLQVASLSYMGDFRMTFGEDRNKVDNIVSPNVRYFRELYDPVLDEFGLERQEERPADNEMMGYTVQWKQNLSARHDHFSSLPSHLKQKIMNKLGKTEQDFESSLNPDHIQMTSNILWAVSSIVNESSWSQSVKGIATAGIFKSIRYSAAKLVKMWRSLSTS